MLTYNHQNYILDAIKSVVNQKTNFIFELLIFDDCSPDGTENLIKHLNNDNPNLSLKYIRNTKNIGPNKNFSLVLKSCIGKYIAICEGDDFWLDSNKLQNQFDFLESNPQYISCGSKIRIANKYSSLISMTSLPYTEYCKGKSYNYEDLCLSNRFSTVTVFFRNNISRISLDLIENSPHGDWPLWVSLYINNLNMNIFVSDAITSSYRFHENGIYSMQNDEKKQLNIANTILILNKITNQEFSFYYYLLCHFLLKTYKLKEDFFNTNFKEINTNKEIILKLKNVIQKSSYIKYSLIFNQTYIKFDKKKLILQLYKECKPSLLVYFVPNIINFRILFLLLKSKIKKT
jgi:glycosyltransferase involved in cell wall biosynthesis